MRGVGEEGGEAVAQEPPVVLEAREGAAEVGLRESDASAGLEVEVVVDDAKERERVVLRDHRIVAIHAACRRGVGPFDHDGSDPLECAGAGKRSARREAEAQGVGHVIRVAMLVPEHVQMLERMLRGNEEDARFEDGTGAEVQARRHPVHAGEVAGPDAFEQPPVTGLHAGTDGEVEERPLAPAHPGERRQLGVRGDDDPAWRPGRPTQVAEAQVLAREERARHEAMCPEGRAIGAAPESPDQSARVSGHPSHSHTPRPITHSRSSPVSHGRCWVKSVMHS